MMQTWTKCSRCGTDAPDVERMALDLIGGYSAVLCEPCENEWQEYVVGTSEWEERQHLQARAVHYHGRALAGDAPSEQECLELVQWRERSDRALFALARAWVAAGKTAAV